jgi:hypothetical protein
MVFRGAISFKASASFLKKRSKKLFLLVPRTGGAVCAMRSGAVAKVFCFFSSEKKACLP